MKDKEAIKARLKSATKRFQCSGCGQKLTMQPSLNCNCGGKIEPIKAVEVSP